MLLHKGVPHFRLLAGYAVAFLQCKSSAWLAAEGPCGGPFPPEADPTAPLALALSWPLTSGPWPGIKSACNPAACSSRAFSFGDKGVPALNYTMERWRANKSADIGGISGLIPSTGVTFPFLSQGGNSLLVLSVAIALVLNIDANERRDALYEQMEAEAQDQSEEA